MELDEVEGEVFLEDPSSAKDFDMVNGEVTSLKVNIKTIVNDEGYLKLTSFEECWRTSDES